MTAFADLRVAVIGECHVSGIGSSLARLLPGATINAWHVNTPATPREIAAQLPSHDVIITQILDLSGLEGLGINDLRNTYGATKRIALIPTIVFTGLQPDAWYVSSREGPLGSPTGVMHSAIIVAAFAAGLPKEEVASLFNVDMYGRLGFFDVFTKAKDRLFEQYEYYGYDLTAHFERWVRAGAFMHVPNHPRIDVLSTVATLAAVQAGLIDPATEPPIDVFDYLATHERYPVYPEIGDQIGIQGSLLWHRSEMVGQGDAREVDLKGLIEAEYTILQSRPDIELLSWRIKPVYAVIKSL
jgi:hypothetical protein